MNARRIEALGLLVILIGGTVAMLVIGWNMSGFFAGLILTVLWWAMFLLQAGLVEARWKAEDAGIERRLKAMSDIDRNNDLRSQL